MSDVTMTHPDLPDQPITVRQDAVSHHQAAGWQVSEDAPNTTPQPKARRRRQTGDES